MLCQFKIHAKNNVCQFKFMSNLNIILISHNFILLNSWTWILFLISHNFISTRAGEDFETDGSQKVSL